MKRNCIIPVICLTTSLIQAENWPQYRGTDGSGHSQETDVPVKWDNNNVAWKAEIQGDGQSTPVIWGNRLFITSARLVENDLRFRGITCYDKNTGKMLWSRWVPGGQAEKIHKMNSFASASCATDGKYVAAFFGPAGLQVYDIEGKWLWSKDLGEFPGPFGNAASPVFLDGKLIQNADAEGPSFLVAYEPATGKEVWRTVRADKPKGGWNTPILIDINGKQEIIVNGEFGVRGYDPANGKELWFCSGYNGRGTPVPAWSHGLLVTLNGKPGDIYAVKPGGKGDVSNTHRAWHTSRTKSRDLSSPIIVDDFVFTVNMMGIASGYHVKTGNELWTERIGGNHSASPIAANGLIYQLNEEGETIVIKPDNKLQVIARNTLSSSGEVFRASPSISEGAIYLRSNKAIYCIK